MKAKKAMGRIGAVRQGAGVPCLDLGLPYSARKKVIERVFDATVARVCGRGLASC
jgi:hypothetical protein